MPNITPRKNKNGEIISYRIRVARGYNSSGKKIKPYEMTWKPAPNMTAKQIQKELQKQAVLFEEQCRQGKISANQNIKLADFCMMYLDIKKDVLSPRVYADYTRTIEKLIIPSLGHIKLAELKPAHIQRFVQYLQGDVKQKRDGTPDEENTKLSASSIKRKLAVLQSILSQATKLEIIPFSPADSKKLTLPKAVTPKVEIFTKLEAIEMLSCLQKEDLQFQVLIQLAIITGCRCGELIGLKFSDIDFDTCKVTVERSAYKITGKSTAIKPPKDYQVRVIAVSRYCIELIKLLQAEKISEQARIGTAWKDNNWLFTQWNGEIMNPQTPSKQFSKFLAKNGLKHRKFHALRHTSATLLLYGDVNLKEVQSRLGHADISTTNKYLHSIAEADEAAANVLQNMLTENETITLKNISKVG